MMFTFKLRLIRINPMKTPRKFTRIIKIAFMINEVREILKFDGFRGISFLTRLEIKSDS